MRYEQASAGAVASTLVPHQYAHDLVVPASYIVVKPKKGHSTTFRVGLASTVRGALAEVRRRGFVPLYVVKATAPRPKPLRLTSAINATKHTQGEG